ncbi:MAG: hypothetical protein ACRDS9_15250 [Pseudonocardiaceae bacterium]
MTIEVVPRDLRKAAVAMEAANEQVENANPCDHIAEVESGLPGGASASQVAPLVSTLSARFEDWCDGATQQSDGYRNAARDYETSDQQAASEGNGQEKAVSAVGDLWTGAPMPGSGFSRGPAIFHPGDPSGGNLKRLTERLGDVD